MSIQNPGNTCCGIDRRYQIWRSRPDY